MALAQIGTGQPGHLVSATVYGTTPNGHTKYTVTYQMTGWDGSIITATGIIAVPSGSAPSGGFPIIVGCHAVVGLRDADRPSVWGGDEANSFGSIDMLLDAGYVVALPDFEGLGGQASWEHPYLHGPAMGRSVLDAARACAGLATCRENVAAWGFSAGGHAAIWAGEMHAQGYASELNVVCAALDPVITNDWINHLFANQGSWGWALHFPAMICYGQYVTDNTLDPTLIFNTTPATNFPNMGSMDMSAIESNFPAAAWRANPVATAPWSNTLTLYSDPGHRPGRPTLVYAFDSGLGPSTIAPYRDRAVAQGTPVTYAEKTGSHNTTTVANYQSEVLAWINNAFAQGIPNANFTWSPGNPAPAVEIEFTDTSSGTPTSWSWDFGDGNTSSDQNPKHTYSLAGLYIVTLTVTNSAGSHTTTKVIPVGIHPGAEAHSHTVVGNPFETLTEYTVTVFARDANGLVGSDSDDFDTQWDQPDAPTFTVSTADYASEGYVTLTWDIDDIDAEWTAWRVYRRETSSPTWELVHEARNLQPEYEFKDWTAKSSVEYEYAVVQVATRFGADVESIYDASAPLIAESPDYWLIHKTDPTKNVRLHVTAEDFRREREQETINLIGRGRKKEFGTDYGYAGSLSASIRRDPTLTPSQQRRAIEALQDEMTSFYLRNPFGDLWHVVAGDIPFERVPGVGTEEMLNIEIEYQEVI